MSELNNGLRRVQIPCHQEDGSSVICLNENRTAYLIKAEGPGAHIVFKSADSAGATLESMIAVLIDKIEGHQCGPHPCKENNLALQGLYSSLHWLNERTKRVNNAG